MSLNSYKAKITWIRALEKEHDMDSTQRETILFSQPSSLLVGVFIIQ
jgi:hypothetical protein